MLTRQQASRYEALLNKYSNHEVIELMDLYILNSIQSIQKSSDNSDISYGKVSGLNDFKNKLINKLEKE